MKKIGKFSQLNFAGCYRVGSSRWLLKQTRGATIFDDFILTILKATYLVVRLVIRIVVGKNRRDKFYAGKKINFSAFLYKSVEILSLDNSLLLVFSVPKYDFKFYTKVTRRIPNFLIDDVYASMSSHEEEVLEHFSPKPGEVVIDIGAAFGFYTLISSMKVGSTGTVIAIEAQPDTFEMLKRNIKLNKLANVIALNYAAYSSEAELKFYSSYSLMPERAGTNEHEFTKVKANTLDYILSQLKLATEVDWIKIDVEGAEFEVLKGAYNILSKSREIKLLIEIHGKENYESIMEFLSLFDFKIEFEKKYCTGDSHILLRKISNK